jgi:hypothetical protein
MTLVLVSILITIILFVVLKKKGFVDEDFYSWGFIIFLSLLLTVFLHTVTYPIKLDRWSQTTTQNIVAMKPDSKIEAEIKSGLFYYRCWIDEVDYYVYLTENNGVYKQECIPVNHTFIKETEGQPKIVETTRYVQNNLPKIMRFRLHPSPEVISETDTIFVPKGTVSNCSEYVVF